MPACSLSRCQVSKKPNKMALLTQHFTKKSQYFQMFASMMTKVVLLAGPEAAGAKHLIQKSRTKVLQTILKFVPTLASQNQQTQVIHRKLRSDGTSHNQAQVLILGHIHEERRGPKGDFTPLVQHGRRWRANSPVSRLRGPSTFPLQTKCRSLTFFPRCALQRIFRSQNALSTTHPQAG